MRAHKYKSFFLAMFGMVLLGILTSCTLLGKKPEEKIKQVKAVQVQYTANDYVKNIALASIAPEERKNSVQIVNKYLAQKQSKPERQALLVLEYKANNDTALRKVAAPISTNQQDAEYPELDGIMKHLLSQSYTLNNLEVRMVNIQPDKKRILPENDDRAEVAAIRTHGRRLLRESDVLPKIEDVTVELCLIKFFIKYRYRDAAYLTVDNAKQSLAQLTQDNPNNLEAGQLMQDLEQLEGVMKSAMPYSL